jgi:hypothetical protein
MDILAQARRGYCQAGGSSRTISISLHSNGRSGFEATCAMPYRQVSSFTRSRSLTRETSADPFGGLCPFAGAVVCFCLGSINNRPCPTQKRLTFWQSCIELSGHPLSESLEKMKYYRIPELHFILKSNKIHTWIRFRLRVFSMLENIGI